MRLLTLSELIDAFDEFEGFEPPVRDLGLVEAAILRQHLAPFGVVQYPTLDLKVAALCDSIARSHPLIDGNKRLCFIAARLTYYLNGRQQLTLSKEALHALFLRIADEHIGVPELAEIFARTFVAELPAS